MGGSRKDCHSLGCIIFPVAKASVSCSYRRTEDFSSPLLDVLQLLLPLYWRRGYSGALPTVGLLFYITAPSTARSWPLDYLQMILTIAIEVYFVWRSSWTIARLGGTGAGRGVVAGLLVLL